MIEAGVARNRRDTAVFVATLATSHVSAYAFHVVMIHVLGARSYGALGAIVGVLTITSIPMSAVQAVVARRIAVLGDDDAQARVAIRSALRFCGIAAVGLTVLLAAGSPLLGRFLHLGTLDVAIAVAGLAIPSCLSPVGRGVLQGRHRFPALGMSLLTSMAARLGFGTAFVAAGMGVRGAVLGLLLGEFLALAVTFIPIRGLLTGARHERDQVSTLLRDSAGAAAVMGAFWTMVSIDVVLARHFLTTSAAGKYATAAFVGKTILYLPSAVAMIVFPRLAEQPMGERARRTLGRSMLFVWGVGMAATAGIVLFPRLGAFIFGPAFYAAGRATGVLAYAMSAFGVAGLLMYQCLALRISPIRTMWTVTALEIGGIVLFHGSPMAIAIVTLCSGGALVLSLFVVAARATRMITLPEGKLWKPPAGDIDLTVVTPVYNAAERVAAQLGNLLASLDDAGIRSEVILVSDGSTDGSHEVAKSLESDRVRVLHYQANRGKGFALRMGMAMASGAHVAFIDADGDLDAMDLARFLRLMPMYGADLVVGSKRHPLSQVSYPLARRIMSWGYHLLVRVLFGVKVSDTQTGIKLVRRDALAEVLPRMVEKRYAFDLELIVAMTRAGHGRILEAPVHLNYQFTSTVSKAAVFGIVRDTLAIWYRRYLVRQYDGDVAASPAMPASPAAQPVPQHVAAGGD